MTEIPPIRSRFRNVVLEAHRRSLWRVLGVYLVASWIGYEVILGLTEGVGLPAWVPGFAVVLFIIGLPVVLATAFVQEGMPGRGVEDPADRGERSTPPHPPRRLLTWPKALTVGVLAFAALGVGATGFLGMRAMGIGPAGTLVAKGELEAREPLVVADFDALSGDTSLALVVTEGLRADLAQSTFVTVADRARVRETLERMLRPAGAPLDHETAREVALRLGLKAVVEGEVGRAGAGYLLTARVVTADSARTLATFRETAADSTALLGAIEGLSRSLRERVGESLKSVRASVPLARATTASLPALRLAVEGTREERDGNRARAIRLLNEAVELDPGFAWAWRTLATAHYNNRSRSLMLHAIDQAVAHEDRLGVLQRHDLRAHRAIIMGDHPTARREYEELVARDPATAVWHINLSDVAWNQGDWSAAAAHARKGIELAEANAVAHYNLVVALLDDGDVSGARDAIRHARSALPEHPWFPNLEMRLLALEGRFDSIHTAAPNWYWAGLADRVYGRWAEAGEHAREAGVALRATWWDAWDRILVQGDPGGADVLAAIVDSVAVGMTEFPERPIAEAAVALALAGRVDAARRARAHYEARVPEPVRWADAGLLHAADGFIALHDGRHEDAVALLQRARQSSPWTAPVDALLGRAYDAIGRPDSAIAAYARYVDTPWFARLGPELADAVFLVPAHERLALLYDEAGDDRAAASHAARVVELWADADGVVEARVRAMRRILERAAREGGGS